LVNVSTNRCTLLWSLGLVSAVITSLLSTRFAFADYRHSLNHRPLSDKMLICPSFGRALP
jgi:hypothetical protein